MFEKLVLELLKSIGSYIWKFFTEFYSWVFSQLIALIESSIASNNISDSGMWAIDFWEQLNFFFPVNELLATLTALFGYWLILLTIKIALKLFPTVY